MQLDMGMSPHGGESVFTEKHSLLWSGRTWLSFGVTMDGHHAPSSRIEGCAMGVLLLLLLCIMEGKG